MHDSFEKLRDEKWVKKFTKPYDLDIELQRFNDLLDFYQISAISYWSKLYPERLKILSNDAPVVLYYQGNIDLLQETNMITVVGSRDISSYSRIIMENTLKRACRLGIGVVSGLALGVDGFSHEIAISQGAKTVGVIGSGLDDGNFYPLQNLKLKNSILQSGGLVLSEYPPGFKATIYSFPHRNRILAALTDITWVVQAGLKSGTLITANIANELGKTVATTPNSVFDKGFGGNLKLLKDGANIISEPEDIIQLLGLSIMQTHVAEMVNEPQFDSQQEKSVYNLLSLKPTSTDEISLKSGISSVELASILTMLELNGLITNIGSNEWVKSA